jgi:hypothetical protein
MVYMARPYKFFKHDVLYGLELQAGVEPATFVPGICNPAHYHPGPVTYLSLYCFIHDQYSKPDYILSRKY